MNAPSPSPVRIALLGTGTVGSAVLARLARLQSREPALQLVAVANTRSVQPGSGARQARVDAGGDHAEAAVRALGLQGTRIVIDATASDALAGRHAHWLAAGIHVVTACKLGQGAGISRWRAIRSACDAGSGIYGDSATVGAGLPVLRTLRALQAGGDRIRGVAGVLSGSLAWLLSQYDGIRPFAELVEQARLLGYTEPDPRADLSGEDVRRKLLILARASGVALEAGAVEVAPLDGDLLPRAHAAATRAGHVLRHVARLDCDAGGVSARVGLESLPVDNVLAAAGSDNRVAIWSDRYAAQPLLIQGPGAGADVTAAALLDDVLGIARAARSYDAAVTGVRTSVPRYSSSGRGWSMA